MIAFIAGVLAGALLTVVVYSFWQNPDTDSDATGVTAAGVDSEKDQ